MEDSIEDIDHQLSAEHDEAYVGGKERNKHSGKRTHSGGGVVGKTPVIGALARKNA